MSSSFKAQAVLGHSEVLHALGEGRARTLRQLVSGHWSCFGMCVFTALLNRCQLYPGLRYVLGSLGFGLNKRTIHWEFGNPIWITKSDFMMPDGKSTDMHVWLEDASGNVYDILYPAYLALAQMNGVVTDALRTTNLADEELVEGVSKSDLAKRGFHYSEAPSETQMKLFQHLCVVHGKVLAVCLK